MKNKFKILSIIIIFMLLVFIVPIPNETKAATDPLLDLFQKLSKENTSTSSTSSSGGSTSSSSGSTSSSGGSTSSSGGMGSSSGSTSSSGGMGSSSGSTSSSGGMGSSSGSTSSSGGMGSSSGSTNKGIQLIVPSNTKSNNSSQSSSGGLNNSKSSNDEDIDSGIGGASTLSTENFQEKIRNKKDENTNSSTTSSSTNNIQKSSSNILKISREEMIRRKVELEERNTIETNNTSSNSTVSNVIYQNKNYGISSNTNNKYTETLHGAAPSNKHGGKLVQAGPQNVLFLLLMFTCGISFFLNKNKKI